MFQKPKIKVSSIIIIVAAFIVFFPLGIFMLISELNKSNVKYYDIKTTVIYSGAIFCAFAALFNLIDFYDYYYSMYYSFAEELTSVIIFASLAAVLFTVGSKRSRKQKMYNTILTLVNFTQVKSIDEISAHTSLMNYEIYAIITSLMSEGYISNVRLDYETMTIEYKFGY